VPVCVSVVCVKVWVLKLECVLKNDDEYPKDAGVAIPWQPLGIPFAITPLGQLHQAPPSPIPWDLVTGKRSQLPVDMLEHRDTCGQAQVCRKSRQWSSGAHGKRRGCSIRIFISKHDFFDFGELSLAQLD